MPMLTLTPQMVLDLYAQGIFPMAEDARSPEVMFLRPQRRGQISITDMHIPRSLRRLVRKYSHDITLNQDFARVIDACAEPGPGREQTWINFPIRQAFIDLHHKGHAHSLELRDADGHLVGGLYGLALGGIFCGESMFSRIDNASKILLVHLCARLWRAGFKIFDIQFINAHLEQFGAYEIDNAVYMAHVTQLQDRKCDITLAGDPLGRDEAALVEAYMGMRGLA